MQNKPIDKLIEYGFFSIPPMFKSLRQLPNKINTLYHHNKKNLDKLIDFKINNIVNEIILTHKEHIKDILLLNNTLCDSDIFFDNCNFNDDEIIITSSCEVMLINCIVAFKNFIHTTLNIDEKNNLIEKSINDVHNYIIDSLRQKYFLSKNGLNKNDFLDDDEKIFSFIKYCITEKILNL